MTDLFEQVIDGADAERRAFRQAPAGDYHVVIRAAKQIKSGQKGTPGIELTFTLREYLGDADMEGVDLARCRLSDTLWVTDNTVGFVKEKLARINPDVVGVSMRDALDILPGSEVVVKLKHVTENSKGETLNIPRLEVQSYYSQEWYFANKRAA